MNAIYAAFERARVRAALDQARANAREERCGERHLGFVCVIGETFHAETCDGRSLGSFPTNEAAEAALLKAMGL